jgi:hypothetical protein
MRFHGSGARTVILLACGLSAPHVKILPRHFETGPGVATWWRFDRPDARNEAHIFDLNI